MKGLQWLALILTGSLFALTGLRQFFVEPLDDTMSNSLWFLLQVLPVLAILPGLLRASGRGYFYAILVAMLYFIHGVMAAANESSRQFGLWEIAFSVGLVVVGSLAMRRLQQATPPSAERDRT